jgi:hypothetical protein
MKIHLTGRYRGQGIYEWILSAHSTSPVASARHPIEQQLVRAIRKGHNVTEPVDYLLSSLGFLGTLNWDFSLDCMVI